MTTFKLFLVFVFSIILSACGGGGSSSGSGETNKLFSFATDRTPTCNSPNRFNDDEEGATPAINCIWQCVDDFRGRTNVYVDVTFVNNRGWKKTDETLLEGRGCNG